MAVTIFRSLGKIREDIRAARALRRWKRNGCPAPPPHVLKQRVVLQHAAKYDLKHFIETGTFQGDMVAAVLDRFESIISIELSEDLWRKAVGRFDEYSHVHIIHGDSASTLAKVIPDISHPALFWLDGHFSGGETARGATETPIHDELTAILRRPVAGDVILIDDARLFGSNPDYPSLELVKAFIHALSPGRSVLVRNDIIRVLPDDPSIRP